MPSDSMINEESMNFDSEDNSDIYSHSPEPTIRHYVDPWDLENYAYMRKHATSTPEPNSIQSFTGELADSTFYYIPGTDDTGTYSGVENFESFPHFSDNIFYRSFARFAGIDEAHFMNDQIYFHNEYNPYPQEAIYYEKRRQLNDYKCRNADCNTSSGSDKDSGLRLSTLKDVSKPTKRRQSMAIAPQKPFTLGENRRHSLAIPPHQENLRHRSHNMVCSHRPTFTHALPTNNLCDLHTPGLKNHKHSTSSANMSKIYRDYESLYGQIDTQHVLMSDYVDRHAEQYPIPIYEERPTMRSKPNHFGLSNYGHLKIDYSWSWNSLDRFICK